MYINSSCSIIVLANQNNSSDCVYRYIRHFILHSLRLSRYSSGQIILVSSFLPLVILKISLFDLEIVSNSARCYQTNTSLLDFIIYYIQQKKTANQELILQVIEHLNTKQFVSESVQLVSGCHLIPCVFLLWLVDITGESVMMLFKAPVIAG